MVRLLLVALLLLPAAVRADDDSDRAYRALQRGEVRPLTEILATIGPALDGEIVGVEFDREDGRWVYEFEVITPGGRLLEVYVDAATGALLKTEDDD